MVYKVPETNIEIESFGTWLRFESAVQRRELEIHKNRCLPETIKEIREQAVQDVLRGGTFHVERSEKKAND